MIDWKARDLTRRLKRLCGIHIHEYITELEYYEYCKTCGYPFSCIAEAKRIMKSKKETRRLNELLAKRRLPRGHIRVKSRTDHTRLSDPLGLTAEEELEFQMLKMRKFK